jgi:hypothetical protein
MWTNLAAAIAAAEREACSCCCSNWRNSTRAGGIGERFRLVCQRYRRREKPAVAKDRDSMAVAVTVVGEMEDGQRSDLWAASHLLGNGHARDRDASRFSPAKGMFQEACRRRRVG